MAFNRHLTEFPRNLWDFQSYGKACALGDSQISWEFVGIPMIPRSVCGGCSTNFLGISSISMHTAEFSLEIQACPVDNCPIS